MKATTKNLNNNMDKKNQYKFLYDVLGNSIIIEDLSVTNNNSSEDNQTGNILINPKKEQYLKFTFFSNHKDNNKERSNDKKDSITLYFKSRIIKNDTKDDLKEEKTKIYIDTDAQLLLKIFDKDIQDKKNKSKNKHNNSKAKDKSEENSNSVNEVTDSEVTNNEDTNNEDRDYILYNLFYENDKIYIKNKELISDEDNEIKIENIDIEQVSNDLRGYSTLRANNANSYLGRGFFFIICERGFAISDFNTKVNIRRFHNFVILFLLAIAYNLKMDDFLIQGAEVYNKHRDNIEEISDLQESIYAFNLQYFFENPVKIDRHQLYAIWSIISKNYNIKTKHDEVNTQVLELTNLLENRKSQAFNKNISLIGIVLAIAPILIDIANLYIKESYIFKRFVAYSLIIILLILIITTFGYIPKLLNFIGKKLKSIYKRINIKNKY